MKRCTLVVFFAFCLPLLGQTNPAVQDFLSFAPQGDGALPAEWFVNPPAGAHPDNQVVHSGRWSVRFDRDASSEGSFSTIARGIPLDFAGSEIELRGFFRTKDVTGFAGLWLREDHDGKTLKIENMESQHVNGTHDWTEHSIKLPVDANANQLFFGVLLAGKGTLWADDLKLLVDDKPIERKLTVLDTDHQFDQGSQITLTSLTPTQIDNLFTLGRVWGFLKYHHPSVVAGKRQWDYDLLRILPAILAAPDRAQANEALVHWIDSLGQIPSCSASECSPTPAGDLHPRPDVDWIRDRDTLGPALSMSLQRIYQNRARTSQFYVNFMIGVGNPGFEHELPYSSVKFPDPGFQLLALFRWWNIMQYWAPYRDDAGQNWPAILAEFIPKLALAKDRNDYQLAMMQLIAKANDTHANLWSSLDVRPPVGTCALPVDIRFVDGEAVVAGFPADSDSQPALRVGDVIESLDGTPIQQLLNDWTPYYADSNAAARQRDFARTLTKGACQPVAVKVKRDGKPAEISAERRPLKQGNFGWHDLPGDTFRMLSPDVAYLKLSTIKAADVAPDMELARNSKGLIVDIRNYPSEFMPFVLGPYLVKNRTAFATFTSADPSNPGAFRFGSPVSIDPGAVHYEGKVVILIDETSQSQAEYTAMALRAAPNTVIVGSTTAGADGNVSPIPLPGGLRTMISGIGVFYPNHSPTQRIGIVPDVPSRPTLAGIKAGRDEVLETAIRQILGAETPQSTIEKLSKPDGGPQPAPTKPAATM